MPGMKIVLDGARPGREGAAIGALARLFYLPETQIQQIFTAVPCVLADGLTPEQADGVYHAMFSALQAGAVVQISNAPEGSVAKINFPQPLKIHGRSLDDFKRPPTARANFQFSCPCCGALLSASPTNAATPGATPAAVPPAHAARPPAPARPAQAAKSPPGAAAEPVVLPTRTAGGKSSPPGGSAGVIEGLDDLEELDALAPQPLPPMPKAGGRTQAKPQPKPLPEIPQAPPERPKPVTPGQPRPVRVEHTGPMEMADFEAGFGAAGAPPPAAAQGSLEALDAGLPDLGVAEDPLAGLDIEYNNPRETPGTLFRAEPSVDTPAKSGRGRARKGGRTARTARRRKSSGSATPTLGQGTYSVVVSGSKKANFIKLLAEVLGISDAEARKWARKPVISVAKSVSKKAAEDLKARFATAGISARITAKSSR